VEAERVASEAQAEPDRAPPAGTAPAPVLLQHAPAEYVRSLSRAYGNRRVAALLQRQPATAAPPAIAKGYKAVSLQDPRWQKVDDLLTWTQLGWEAREVMRTYAVPLAEAVAGGGAPAFYDAKGNVCYLNLSSSPAEISTYFVHEMHHAKQARTGNSPGAEGFPNTEEHRRKWVAMMVEEEVVGTAMGFEHKRRLENRGLADRNDRPAGMGSYRRVYNLWRDKALAEGKDEVAAGAAGREKALARVRLMIANPGGRASPELGPPGGVGESYEDFYAREFRKSPHPSAVP
jgi:hypothetical protein